MRFESTRLIDSRVPFERALSFANQENITEDLFPLFLHNIDALLSASGAGQPGANVTMNPNIKTTQPSSERQDSTSASEATPQRPRLTQQHSVADTASAHQAPHAIVPNPEMPRPGLERAQTYPHGASHSSSTMGMGNAGSSYEYGVSAMPSGHGPSDSKSVPTTPATTPPDHSGPTMPQQYTSVPAYDTRHSASGHPTQQQAYAAPTHYGYGAKTDMGPPPPASAKDSSSHPGYDHGGYSYSGHAPLDTTVSPHSRSSPQTAPGSAHSGHWSSGYAPQPVRSQTLPSSHVSYPPKTSGPSNGYLTQSAPSHEYAYSSAAGSSAKRTRTDDDEVVRSDYDYAQKRQRTTEEAAAKYRTRAPRR